MKPHAFVRFSAFTLACATAVAAHAEQATSTISFSDPAKPGTVKVMLGRGDLWVQGADTPDVIVKSEAKAVSKAPRKDGLRVLTASSSFSLTEAGNIVTLDGVSDMGKGGSEFRLTVPKSTTLVVQNSWGGEITCSNLDGDIEIKSMNGEIRLNDIGGGVLVETMNGEISATIRELRDNKPLSFTSWNGEVVLRVPAEAKASVRLRTQNGSVLTDFDETALVTKTENTAGSSASRRIREVKSGRVISEEVRESIREAAQVGATAVKQALEAVREGLDAARVSADEASKEVDAARRELERSRARTAKPLHAANGPVPPVPPKPPIPTISGGKLVTGTLNGGGPEISVATMNGDVTLRRLVAKP
ncbi:DUF4097 family beta strand repeat-containing protein [Horticoccus sp. 23ND18S-11]|uniref:DUF4097 family beta strand repeat-containing protein n=1 Tax=Horticoccus sp. 23ND18S-11 TaxID=3391832 RepID=UPI0039C942FF